MQTIVVAASRPLAISDMAIMAGIALVVVLLAWKVLMGVKRHRHEPHA